MTPFRITISPNPTTAGSDITICYDTTGCTFPIRVEVRFPPSMTPVSLVIEEGDVSAEMPVLCWPAITVPADATHIIATDTTNQSQDGVCTVLP